MTDTDGPIRLVLDLRRAGITDTRVLSAMERIPRERFVSEAWMARAYDNVPLPIDCGQTISQPFVVAFMTQALAVEPRNRVLEVGTGSGYQAAVLSLLCQRVYGVERHRALKRLADARIGELGIGNVVTRWGDGRQGWPDQAPFDRIMVTAGAEAIPPMLLNQLMPGGILIAPVDAEGGGQTLIRVQRGHDGTFATTELLAVRFVPLLRGLAQESTDPRG